MSRITSYLLGFITLCTTITVWGQDQITRPKDCATAPSGITLGGSFNVSPYACLNYTTGSTTVIVSNPQPPSGIFDVGAGSEIKYNFNYRNSDNPNGDLEFTPGTPPIYTYTQEGTYWIAVSGKQGSNTYLICNSVEVIKTEVLDVNVSSCDPSNVSIEIKDTPSNRKQGKVLIEWGDGDIETKEIPTYPTTITHNYASPPVTSPKIQGLYVRGVSGTGVCTSQAVNFNVGTNVAPKISELEGLNAGTEAKITMKGGNAGEDYVIEMKTGTGAWAPTTKTIKAPTGASATSTETISGLSATNEYCFRLQKAGACASPIYSNEVCTINPTHQVISAKAVKVDWTSRQANITRYEVVYKESLTGLNQNTGFTQPTEKTFTFDQMDCSVEYDFQILGIVGNGPLADRVTIKSPVFVVKPTKGGIVPFENLLIVSTGTNVAKVNTLYSFPKTNIYRSEGNSTDFQKITTISTTDWEDANVQIDKQQYCYKVEYEDDCGNTSEQSPSACTIFLTSSKSNTLNWTPFSVVGPPSILQSLKPTEYTIRTLDADGNVVGTSTTFDTEENVINQLNYWLDDPSMNGKVTFIILAQQEADLILSSGDVVSFPFFGFSNPYTFTTPARVFFPSAFTPNDDSHNDVFLATGKFIAEFNMVIYDRWGAPIFQSNDITHGWDGRQNGNPAPAGYYSFKIYGIDNSGQEFSKTGSVLLIR